MTKKAAADDFPGRFREIVSDPLNLLIQRVPQAGLVRNGWVSLHNGNLVPIEGPGAYFGDFSQILVINRGVLEPLSEFIFQELLKRLPQAPVMIELGEFSGYYGMWMKRARPEARVVLVGAKQKRLEAAQAVFAHNALEAEFVTALLRRDAFEVDAFVADQGGGLLDVILIDSKGAEVEMLDGAAGLLERRGVGYLLVATHSDTLHEAVIERLARAGYRIETASGFGADTTSHKGVVFASNPDAAPVFEGFDPMGRNRIALASPDLKLDYLNAAAAARPSWSEGSDAMAAVSTPRPNVSAGLTHAEAVKRYRGLEIYLPFQGKNAFEVLDHLPLELREGPPSPEMGRGAVVFPFPYSVDIELLNAGFERLAGAWSEAQAAKARAGELRLIFDASAEGMEHNPDLTRRIFRGLAELGVPPRQAYVITQDRNYAEDHAVFCAAEHIGEPLNVVTYDLWIKRFHAQFADKAAKRLHRVLASYRARRQHRSKTFVSLNLSPRPTKLLFLLSLLRDGLWDRGYISFGGFRKRHSAIIRSDESHELPVEYYAQWLPTFPGFAELGKELAPLLPALAAKGELHFGSKAGEGNRPHQKTPLKPVEHEYDDSWFSVITETEMRARPSRITEKPFKSLVSFHPLLMLGNPGSLKAIRSLGYATFGDVIDERYDDEEDPRRRFDMVYREVLRLCAMSEEELWRMERQISPKLEFNAEWGLCRLAARYRNQLDLTLMERLFGEA